MKVLLVSSQVPFRESRFGGAKRLYYLAKELERRTELHVLCLDACGEFPSGVPVALEFKRSLHIQGKSSGVFDRFRIFPDSHAALHGNRDKVIRFLNGTRFDAVLVAYPQALALPLAHLLQGSPRFVYLDDDLYLEQLRRHVHSASGWFRRTRRARFLRSVTSFYRKRLARFSAQLCISPEEAEIVRRLFPGLSVHVLGYGIPAEEFQVLPDTRGGHVLGYIGNYRHSPNVDAARWLAATLFPAVARDFPDAKLVLCGANPPETLRRIAADNPAIALVGEVGDLASFYGPIDIFVNAVREGRGLRTKVVEAAAYGRAVVTTALGAEGLGEFKMPIFQDAQELIEALTALDNPETRRKIVAWNRSVVEKSFSLRAAGQVLMQTLGSD